MKTKINPIDKFVDAAMEKFDATELLSKMFDRAKGKDQDYLVDEMIATLTLHREMYIVKLDSMEQKNKMEDFVCNQIFPHYNDQQTHLFAY